MITKLINNYYKEQFTYKESYNLDLFAERNLKFIDGEEYFINEANRSESEYKGWKVISGNLFNVTEGKSFNYALAITPSEYKKIIKL